MRTGRLVRAVNHRVAQTQKHPVREGRRPGYTTGDRQAHEDRGTVARRRFERFESVAGLGIVLLESLVAIQRTAATRKDREKHERRQPR